MPSNNYSSRFIDINKNEIKGDDIITPTYGYFIFSLKNIWINNDKWGINIYCNGGMILPSQYVESPPIPEYFNLFI